MMLGLAEDPNSSQSLYVSKALAEGSLLLHSMLGEILYLQQSTVPWLAESLLQQLVFAHSLSAETVF